MTAFKPLLKYFLFFSAFYLCLLGLFSIPFVRNGVIMGYCKSADAFVNLLLSKAYVHIQPNPEDKPDKEEVRILYGSQAEVDRQLEEAKNQGIKKLNIPLKFGYFKMNELLFIPLIYLLALIAISPVSAGRKAKGAVIGLLLLWAFILIKSWIVALSFIAHQSPDIYAFSAFRQAIIYNLHRNLSVTVSFLAATFIWILLIFNKSDWQNLIVQLTRVAGEQKKRRES